ncbi:hypothetical protein N7456_002376 [Penicillium angulare]|uniref:Xylanolytic transcriptional activator regulatory domain-containing protein n=1 Tax=Penicillium angulare TaxID=116970 RepID=A0A9W9G9B7_9EURO|nr:hypothetical protein N7456_002376 [Penicillium angulare]
MGSPQDTQPATDNADETSIEILDISHFIAMFADTHVVEDLLNRHIRLSHSKPPAKSGKGSFSSFSRPDHSNDNGTNINPSQQNSYRSDTQEHRGIQIPSDESCPDSSLVHPQPINAIQSYTGGENNPSESLLGVPFLNEQNGTHPFTFSYLDNVSLPPIFDQAAFYPGISIADPFLSPEFSTVHKVSQDNPLGIDGEPSPERSNGFPDHQTSFLAGLEPDRQHINSAPFLRVSQEDWQWLSGQVAKFSSVLPPSINLPSRHAISRYMHGFMTGFHPHFPIIHPQTLHFREMAPELILALAAVGSQYCLESHQGVKLFPVAKAISTEQLRRREAEKEAIAHNSPVISWSVLQSPLSLPRPDETITQLAGSSGEEPNEKAHQEVETMQALFFLMAMATWGGENRSLVRQAVAAQSVLAMVVRQLGLTESPSDSPLLSWEGWAREESSRRTKLIIFSFFNLHTIAFNLPSPIMLTDIQLRIPCTEMEWKATEATAWRKVHEQSAPMPLFQDCFKSLLNHSHTPPHVSSLGGHVLVHALIQRIICVKQAIGIEESENQLAPGLSLILRQALRKWQNGWEQNPESSYSPLDKYGPIAFNSRALYHLAHIRLTVDIGSARSLLEQTSSDIARRLYEGPNIGKSPQLILAARHATAALCSPVQMGVHFVGRAPSWSVMHAVCSLEYAYILNQFLEAYATPGDVLGNEERALMDTIKETLYEVETSLPHGNPRIFEAEPRVLGPKAVRAWAMILDGMRTWNAVSLITRALFSYADLLERQVFQNPAAAS